MSFINCQFEQHGTIVLEIFNEVIENSTALYETKPRTIEQMQTWFSDKQQQNYPILGYENEQGELLGFISYGRYRPQPATHKTVEHSLYVHPKSRGQKVGQKLLEKYIQHITDEGYHTTIAAIDSENIPCIKLHQKFGFICNGKMKEVARKFDRWLDLEYYQLILTNSPLSDES